MTRHFPLIALEPAAEFSVTKLINQFRHAKPQRKFHVQPFYLPPGLDHMLSNSVWHLVSILDTQLHDEV